MACQARVIEGIPGGGGRTIEVDEAIFGVLTYEKHDGETYSDVVRRLMGLPAVAGE